MSTPPRQSDIDAVAWAISGYADGYFDSAPDELRACAVAVIEALDFARALVPMSERAKKARLPKRTPAEARAAVIRRNAQKVAKKKAGEARRRLKRDGLTDTQRRVLEVRADHPTLLLEECADMLAMTKGAYQQHLRRALQAPGRRLQVS